MSRSAKIFTGMGLVALNFWVAILVVGVVDYLTAAPMTSWDGWVLGLATFAAGTALIVYYFKWVGRAYGRS